jgi:hypothetical protein
MQREIFRDMQNFYESDDMDRVSVDGLLQIHIYQTQVVAYNRFVITSTESIPDKVTSYLIECYKPLMILVFWVVTLVTGQVVPYACEVCSSHSAFILGVSHFA